MIVRFSSCFRKILTLASLFVVIAIPAGVANAQNLLLNGDFALNRDGGTGDDDQAQHWTHNWSAGWISREKHENGPYGDPNNYHYAIGNAGAIDNSAFQNVLVPDNGAIYLLTADVAMDDWWSPTGFLRMEFLDAGSSVLGTLEALIVANGFDGDVNQPWSLRSVTGAAPIGTESINVRIGGLTDNANGNIGNGGGTIRFDNVSLTVVPEPSSLVVLAIGLGGLLICRRR